uniref:Uncharacterized protein n=1 Tax=Arundo donax TaxID=35708 RepID=A0A0A9FUC3_ARUDO
MPCSPVEFCECALNVAWMAVSVPSISGRSCIDREPFALERTNVFPLDTCVKVTSCELYAEGTTVIQSEIALLLPDFASQSPVDSPARTNGPNRTA